MNHRVGRSLFALVVGLGVAFYSYQWITNPAPRAERALQESAVMASRSLLADKTGVETLEFVDPVAPDRKVGKVFVYREAPGWAVSGYYRRSAEDSWHPYLISMSEDLKLSRLKVQDTELIDRAASDPTLEIIR